MTSDSLRILVTTDWFSPNTGGGAERVAYEVAVRLAAAGHRMTILATQPPEGGAFAVPDGLELITVPAYDLSTRIGAQVSVAPGIVARTARILDTARPDVVLGHSLQFQTTLAAAILSRRRHVPFVVTAHIADLRAVNGLVGVAARVHEATVGRLILRLASRAIAVSEPVAAHLRSLDRGVTVDVVPNGVDRDRFHPAMLPHSGSLRVGLLGRLIANKGPATAVRALAIALSLGVDARLFIAGEGPEEPALRNLATSLGMAERVDFEGHQSDSAAWLRRIDVMVRPSLTEGMPLGILEAMAAGVPVIASDVPGNAALIGPEERGILVPAGDPQALARALERLARDPALGTDMREAGLAAARTFTWERTADETMMVLRRAVDEGPATALPSRRGLLAVRRPE